jgi:hypothetical protein
MRLKREGGRGLETVCIATGVTDVVAHGRGEKGRILTE